MFYLENSFSLLWKRGNSTIVTQLIHIFLDLLSIILQCGLECLKFADYGLVKKDKAIIYFAVYKSWTNIGFKRF